VGKKFIQTGDEPKAYAVSKKPVVPVGGIGSKGELSFFQITKGPDPA
jgi:hypothetical protein